MLRLVGQWSNTTCSPRSSERASLLSKVTQTCDKRPRRPAGRAAAAGARRRADEKQVGAPRATPDAPPLVPAARMPPAREAAGCGGSAAAEVCAGALVGVPRPAGAAACGEPPDHSQGRGVASRVPERAETRYHAGTRGSRRRAPLFRRARHFDPSRSPSRRWCRNGRSSNAVVCQPSGVRLELVDAVPAPSAPRTGGAAGGTPSGRRAKRPRRCSVSRSAAPTPAASSNALPLAIPSDGSASKRASRRSK